MISAKDVNVWPVHSPSADTRINATSIQLGNQVDQGYDHASGFITSSDQATDSLCIIGNGPINGQKISCWAEAGVIFPGSITANSYNNSSDKTMKGDVLDVDNSKCVNKITQRWCKYL